MTAATIRRMVDEARPWAPGLLAEGAPEERKQPPPFELVPIADLVHTDPPAPSFAWEGLIPLEHVTHWSGHGGVAKTLVNIMLAVASAMGMPLFGIPTRRSIVAFYSAEDGAHLLRHRLKFVCRGMGVDIQELEGRLYLIDAASHDPALFCTVTIAGRTEGQTTATFAALRDLMKDKGVGLLIVDNASDTFDASEIERAKVRGFMRALAQIAREFTAAVVLIAHVDKGTSRGERGGIESYSGSTAWHNSARSRIHQRTDKDGALVIEHQKHNLGKLHPPIRLEWPEHGIPQVEAAFGPVVQGIEDRGQERVILKLIAEYTERGEFVTTAPNGRPNAPRLLRGEPGFPERLNDADVLSLLRKAERAGRLQRITYKGADRHQRERWDVTDAGRTFAGLPPAGSAGSAGSDAHTADTPLPAAPAGSAGSEPAGGMGVLRAAELTAEEAAP